MIVDINNIPYAIVVSGQYRGEGDNGVQIIDLSNPDEIKAAGEATDSTVANPTEFTALKGAYGGATFTVDNILYAIVVSEIDDGVQIISLTVPITGNSNTKKNGGGCADCTPPTFGKNKDYVLIVEDGFTYNGNSIDVTDYHTEFPLITVVTNQTNTVTAKVYENGGIHNIKLVQFGMGMPEVGSSLSYTQTLVEIWLDGTQIDKIVKVDKNNLVEIISATSSVVDCMTGDVRDCLEITIQYIYRDQPKYNIMAINAMDIPRNSKTNYLNDGILVTGDSLNEPLEQSTGVSHGGAFYPQKTGTVLLTLIDYKTDMWQDEYGYTWSTNQYGPYIVDLVPVPQREPDAYSEWSGYNHRTHSEFESYKQYQIDRASQFILDN